MKLDDNYDYEFDYEEHTGRINMGVMVIVVSVFILAILVVVVLINQKPSGKKVPVSQTIEESETEEVDEFGYPATSQLIEENGLTPEDLDFWDMYPEEGESMEPDVPGEDEKKLKDAEKKKESEEEETETEDGKDPMDDGRHTLIEYRDGTREWVVISPYLSKNTYDFTKLVSSDNQMKYVEDGKSISFIGVDISRYQGEVDFYQLKDAGIDFVMLRVGARGYSSGEIMMDETFADNIQKASEAGLDIGVYFYSQAVTQEEAVEEANVVIQSLGEYKLQYPVAFDMEYVENDTARVEALSRVDKTNITKAFLDTIQAAGYRAMIYGDKEWLIKRIDLSKLNAYDIWLSQDAEIPDYPYKFAMWQYTTSAQVNGIDGYANLNICFIDYAAR